MMIIILLSSCYPSHKVCDGKLVIYKKKELPKHPVYKYKYAVKDRSAIGWTLYTSKNYMVNDTLNFK